MERVQGWWMKYSLFTASARERDPGRGEKRVKRLFLRRLQLNVTQCKHSLTRVRKMERVKEGKVHKILRSGDQKRKEMDGGEGKQRTEISGEG